MSVRAERAALREDTATLLAEMGETASEVAVFLASTGVSLGFDADDSPAARYLQAVIGSDSRVKRVRVTKRAVRVKTERRWRSTIRLGLPDAVKLFVASRTRPSVDKATGVRSE